MAGAEFERRGNRAAGAPDIVDEDGGGGVEVADGEQIAGADLTGDEERFGGAGPRGGEDDDRVEAVRQRRNGVAPGEAEQEEKRDGRGDGTGAEDAAADGRGRLQRGKPSARSTMNFGRARTSS